MQHDRLVKLGDTDLTVRDPAGTFLGTLSHIEIDPTTGQIMQLTAHEGGMLGTCEATTPINARAIISIGPELLTVNPEASVLAGA